MREEVRQVMREETREEGKMERLEWTEEKLWEIDCERWRDLEGDLEGGREVREWESGLLVCVRAHV